MELILFSLGYRRVNGGQGWYCYENNETGIIIDYHVARTAHRFERRIEVDFTVRDLNRKRLCLANFPGEYPLTYETQAELDGKLRHTFDATVNMALPYIQDMKKYAVPVPCLKDYQALADHPERRAELFSFKYHIPLIPDKSSLIQLDSILQSIRPKNLYELRDSFQANYEDLINMAAFYGILFAKKSHHYCLGWAPLIPQDAPIYPLIAPEPERFLVLEIGDYDSRPGVRADVLLFVIEAWNYLDIKGHSFSSFALL